MRRNWTAEEARQIKTLLGESDTMPEAMWRLKEAFGDELTQDAVTSLFRRIGLNAPGTYLRTPAKPGPLPKWTGAPIGELDLDDSTDAGFMPHDDTYRMFIIPDVHAPEHCERAFDTALKGGERWLEQVPAERRIVLIQGDFLDCFQVSFHPKTPGRGQNLEREIAVSMELLDRVENLGASKVVFTSGNHEQRLSRYLSEKAPALFDFVSMERLLHISERPGWQWIPYRDHTMIGDALCTHDIGFAGKYATVRGGETVGCSILTGHTHRSSVQHFANTHGEQFVSASFGWLGDFDSIDYMHRAKYMREWSHGFGTGVIDSTGKVHVQAHIIRNGRTVVDGRELAA